MAQLVLSGGEKPTVAPPVARTGVSTRQAPAAAGAQGSTTMPRAASAFRQALPPIW